MRGKVLASKIENVIKEIRKAKPHLFHNNQPISMELSWELLREVRWCAIDNNLNPKNILKVMGFEPLEYERITF